MSNLTNAAGAYNCPVLTVFLVELEPVLSPGHTLRLANLLATNRPVISADVPSKERAILLADWAVRVFMPLLMEAVGDTTLLTPFISAAPLRDGAKTAFHLRVDSMVQGRHPDIEGAGFGAAGAARQVLSGGLRIGASNATRVIREAIQLVGWPRAEGPFFELLDLVLHASPAASGVDATPR
jgi:hypothetical protein